MQTPYLLRIIKILVSESLNLVYLEALNVISTPKQKKESSMKTMRRSNMIVPAWLMILTGSVAFFYCAWMGLLGS